MRVYCNGVDQCCRIAESEPKFLPLILYYIQQWSNSSPKIPLCPPSHANRLSLPTLTPLTLPRRKSRNYPRSSASRRNESSRSINSRSRKSTSNITSLLRNPQQSQWVGSTRRHMKRKESIRSNAEKNTLTFRVLRTSRAGTRKSSRLWGEEDLRNCSTHCDGWMARAGRALFFYFNIIIHGSAAPSTLSTHITCSKL